jgi:hypothetical protein
MPVCIKCKEEKTEDQFRKSSRAKSGLEGKCKECRVTPAPKSKAEFKWGTEGTIQTRPVKKAKDPNVSKLCYRCMKQFRSLEDDNYITCLDCAEFSLFPCDCCKIERQYYEFPLTSTCYKCKVEAEGGVHATEEKEEKSEIPVGEE